MPDIKNANETPAPAKKKSFLFRLNLTADRSVSFRTWLYISLAASFAVFAGAVFFKFVETAGLLEERRRAEAELAAAQSLLERRMDKVEESTRRDAGVLEQKLRELSEKQAASDARAQGSPIKAPFPLENVVRGVVEIVCIDNVDKDVYFTGSGTVIDKSGVIVTNQHILISDDGSFIEFCGVGFTADLQSPPRIDYIAAATAVHNDADLAVLRITESVDRKPLPKEFPFISVAGSADAARALNLGDPVFIGGYPNVGADTFTFTQGVISGRVGTDFIKTSAFIDTGTSGGAAFDSAGRYVGVPTAAARGEIGGSLGYLIGADVVDKFLADYFAGRK